MELTLDRNRARLEHHVLQVENVRVIGYDYGDDRNASLHGEVEGALLEGKKLGLLGVAARAFREHIDTLIALRHFPGGAGHRLPRIFGVLPIDENSAAQGHELAEEGHFLQRLLGSHTAILWKHASEHEHVQLRLVVSDKHGGPNRVQGPLRIDHLEGNASSLPHYVFKCASSSPLRTLPLSDRSKDDGSDDSVYCAYYKGEVCDERPGYESSLR